MSIDLGNFIEFYAKNAKITANKHFRLFAMFAAADKLNSIFIARS